MRIRPAGESFVHNFVPGPDCGLVCPVLSGRARACRRNHQVPRVSLPDVGVTFIRETCTVSSEDITPRSSLLQTHSPIPSSSPLLWFLASFEESLQVAASPCCSWDLPDAIPQFFPQMPGPQSRRSHRVHLPVSSSMSSAFPRPFLGRLPVSSANTIFPRWSFEIVIGHFLRSSLRVCLSPRSLPPLRIAQGGRDFYFQAERASLPMHALDMLSVRFRQLTEKGLSPFQICGIVGCSKDLPSSLVQHDDHSSS